MQKNYLKQRRSLALNAGALDGKPSWQPFANAGMTIYWIARTVGVIPNAAIRRTMSIALVFINNNISSKYIRSALLLHLDFKS